MRGRVRAEDLLLMRGRVRAKDRCCDDIRHVLLGYVAQDLHHLLGLGLGLGKLAYLTKQNTLKIA